MTEQKELRNLRMQRDMLNAQLTKAADYIDHLRSEPVRVAVRQCLEQLVDGYDYAKADVDTAEKEILRLLGVEE